MKFLRICSGRISGGALLMTALLSASTLFAQPVTFRHFAGSNGGGDAIDATGPAARFNAPTGVAIDGSGNVYVADSYNNTIRKITPAGAVTTLAGMAGTAGSADGTGGVARFNEPTGIAVDNSGNLFVTDRANHTIRKITAAGVVTTIAGSALSFGTNDGTGNNARFSYPSAIAVDNATGNLYVADSWNHAIRLVTPGGVVTTFAGVAGSNGSADGTGGSARFLYPSGICIDGTGKLFVADTFNHTIRQIVISTAAVTTIAGTAGLSGTTDATGTAARFDRPYGIAAVGGNLWVTDSSYSTVRMIDSLLAVTTPAGSPGTYGSADGTGAAANFNFPYGIAAGGGKVYVADRDNHAIRAIASGNVVTTLAGMAAEIGSADGTGAAARLLQPRGAAFDGAGNLFVADYFNCTIRKITAAGVVSTFAGTPGACTRLDGNGTAARLNFPTGIAIDGSNNLYVVEQYGQAVRKITSGAVVTTLAGGSQGSTDGTGAAAKFNQPQAVAVDATGTLFVADTWNHTIRMVTSGGVVTTLAGTAGNPGTTDATGAAARFYVPWGLAVDNLGNLFVADSMNGAIRKVVIASGAVTTFAGTAGLFGTIDGNGGAARFTQPTGLTIDSGGNLYVTSGDQTVRRITPSADVTTLAGDVTVTANHTGAADGTGSAALFNWPYGCAIDGSGNFVVADTLNHSVRKGVAAIADTATIDSPFAAIGMTRTLDALPAAANAWKWTIVQRPPGSSAALSSTSVKSPTFAPDVAGTFVFRLEASSAAGARISRVSLLAGNAPPSIAASGALARTAGSAAVSATIATVSDPEDAAGSLVVTATVPAGISVSGISNSGGTITAAVSASCTAAAGASSVTLRVEDSGGAFSTATLTVNVTANALPTLGTYADATLTAGQPATIVPSAPPADNDTLTLTATASAGFTGSIATNSTTGALSIANPNAGTYTVTVTATDSCGATAVRTFTMTVNAAFGAPASFSATANGSSQVTLQWNAVAQASYYTILRSSNGGALAPLADTTNTAFVDGSVAPSTTYVYEVCGRVSSFSGCSYPEIATTMTFTDDPLTAGGVAKALHITELRVAVNAVRAAGGLAPYTFTDLSLSAGSTIRSAHITELRSALDAARIAIGLAALTWTDPVIIAGSTTMKAAHIQELRNGVK